MFDNPGNRSLSDCRRVLADDGIYLLVGGPKKNRALGPIGRMIRALVRFRFASQRAKAFIASEGQDDIQILVDLMESGEVKTVIDTVYPLDLVGAAMDHLAGGHVRGKLIVKPWA